MKSHIKVIRNNAHSKMALSILEKDSGQYDFMKCSLKASKDISHIISKYQNVGQIFKSTDVERSSTKFKMLNTNYNKQEYNPSKIFSKSKNANIIEYKKLHHPKSTELTKEILKKYTEQLSKYASINSIDQTNELH